MARICPECHVDLDVKKESAKPHALSHWPEVIESDPKYVEARRRQKILYAWAKSEVAPTQPEVE